LFDCNYYITAFTNNQYVLRRFLENFVEPLGIPKSTLFRIFVFPPSASFRKAEETSPQKQKTNQKRHPHASKQGMALAYAL
jgi:hypothetical protein